MTFDEWLYKVCERLSCNGKRDITNIYSSINLFDAKLSFIDGVSYMDYEPF